MGTDHVGERRLEGVNQRPCGQEITAQSLRHRLDVVAVVCAVPPGSAGGTTARERDVSVSVGGRAAGGTVVRAAVLERVGEPIVVRELELRAPRTGEVRVRILASGVCHSDLHVRDGEWDRPTPIVMGHEGAGIVEAVGPGVVAPRVGQLVALSWLIPCGACRSCRRGHSWACPDSPSYRHTLLDGETAFRDVRSYCGIATMAEASVVPAAAAIPVPDGTDPAAAALIGCCVTTGVGAVLKTASVPPGSSVAVIGLGGVGLSCVMGAVVAGASRIVAIDRVAGKLDVARAVGATDTVLAFDDAAATVAALRDLTDGGPDFVFEAIGLPSTAELAIAALPVGGTAVLVGMTPLGGAGRVRGLSLRRRLAAHPGLELRVRRAGDRLPALRRVDVGRAVARGAPDRPKDHP